jgi:hypothetical protein
MSRRGMPMTTTILEPTLLETKSRRPTEWWKAIPARLLARVSGFFHWLNTTEPNMELHQQMKEYHQSKYMHLIHRI